MIVEDVRRFVFDVARRHAGKISVAMQAMNSSNSTTGINNEDAAAHRTIPGEVDSAATGGLGLFILQETSHRWFDRRSAGIVLRRRLPCHGPAQ